MCKPEKSPLCSHLPLSPTTPLDPGGARARMLTACRAGRSGKQIWPFWQDRRWRLRPCSAHLLSVFFIMLLRLRPSCTRRHRFITPLSLFLPPPPPSLSLYALHSDYVRECIVGTGQNYRGRRSVTVSGIRCQAWASPIPHEHKSEPLIFVLPL